MFDKVENIERNGGNAGYQILSELLLTLASQSQV